MIKVAESERERVKISEREKIIGYGGGITIRNGIDILLDIRDEINAVIYLAGSCGDIDLSEAGKADTVKYFGCLPISEMTMFYNKIYVGFCVYKNTSNNYWGLPNKLLEFMERGIPVIVSDFPLYSEIVEESKCGILVRPDDRAGIIAAINYLVDNPQTAQQMGENGRRAVIEKYNWNTEEEKLVKLYRNITKKSFCQT